MKKSSSPVRIILHIIITLVAAAVYFYIVLPPINIRSSEFWMFMVYALAFFGVLESFAAIRKMLSASRMSVHRAGAEVKNNFRLLSGSSKVAFTMAAICLAFLVVVSFLATEFFNPEAYSSLITISDGDFTQDVTEISYDQIPMLDKDSANALANRKLGELSDLVSQFEVDIESAQINYNDKPVRVAYLRYGDFFKWFNNQSKGIPAYMVTDMVTQEVSVIRLSEGMKYSPSEYFNRDILRHLRFNYPTLMFHDVNFEIDEEGVPYYVASVLTKRIMLFGGDDIKGAVLVNAITGECRYYDYSDVPTWVDRVFTAELIIQQYDYYGTYKNGFWNSIFGQTGCTVTTDGYNYIAQDDDVWMYTGVTSLGGDESNVGFILSNQRTKETKYYSIAGAEEYSAMGSAQGSVQQYNYNATFPLLLNIEGQPTYFMALKDASELVKMYAMVNVQQYQIVANGYSLAECQKNYHQLLKENKVIDETVEFEPEKDLVEVTGTVEDIRTAVIGGTTNYYLTVSGQCYRVSCLDNEAVILVNVGDSITLSFEAEAANNIIPANIK